MFAFFRRRETPARGPRGGMVGRPVGARSPANNGASHAPKDVVNLLVPEIDYTQRGGVAALLRKMTGKRRGARAVRNAPAPTPNKNTPETQQHVSLVYVSDEKQHAVDLLREIARRIDCDLSADDSQMGNGESRETDGIQGEKETPEAESPALKKSNLKPPKSDTEANSDDERSDKKRVTFRKHVIFDDGEQQTDDETNSTFESLSSGEESEYLEDCIADNDDHVENRTVISVSEDGPVKIRVECFDEGIKRISSDNSDSGFIEISERSEAANEASLDPEGSEVSESESEMVEVAEEEIEEIVEEVPPDEDPTEDQVRALVAQEQQLQSQISALAALADSRRCEAEKAAELIAECRKDLETKDQEIQQLKCDLADAYKESELVRQRSRSLEEELAAARGCSADLAEQLQRKNDESVRQLKSELEDSLMRRAELESRLVELEREKDRIEQEKELQSQKAQEAIAAAEASAAKWKLAHEEARSQAAARAERILADCEWKMRELERRAKDAEVAKKEFAEKVERLQKSPPTPSHIAELQQLRGLVGEQQSSIQSLSLQLQKMETREEELKLEVHRLKELLEREAQNLKAVEERHLQVVRNLEEQITKGQEALSEERANTSNAVAAARTAAERAAAARTRTALGQLRAEHEQRAKAADRRLRELGTRFQNLKEELASKEAQYERALAEANSKADWDITQLRHLLDKADIDYANKVDQLTENFEKEKERLTEEWTERLRVVEEEAAVAADEARRTLETTRSKMLAERYEQITKLKEQHRLEMEDQWEQFMTDKESCLSRMKSECRQEGEEERVKREKELLKEIADLKAQLQTQNVDFNDLREKSAACERTLAVTDQELREALAREKEEREGREQDAETYSRAEKNSREQIEHLTRKCACLRKLFDDIRARLSASERDAEQESRAKEKELQLLRSEVARLTKILVQQSSPKLGARTRADGCENAKGDNEPAVPPRKGGGQLMKA